MRHPQLVDITEYGLIAGRTYRYKGPYPVKCIGALYRLNLAILDVPSFQTKLFVTAITGPDESLDFCCTISNFTTRYELVPEF